MKKTMFGVLVLMFLFTLAADAFANSGGGSPTGRQITEEEKKVAEVDWVEPPAKKDSTPRLNFYSNGTGQIVVTDGTFKHFRYHFDPEASEYIIIELVGPLEIGRARLVSENPPKLAVSGNFVSDRNNKRVRYQYELSRERDARSMPAPASPGWYTEEATEWAWLEGVWITQSGDSITVTFRGYDLVFFERFDDNGNQTLFNHATAVWDDDEKAFELLHIAMYGGNNPTSAIEHRYGWLRPSSGEFSPSETLELEYYKSPPSEDFGLKYHEFDEEPLRAVLVKENPYIPALPDDVAKILYGNWTARGSDLSMTFTDGEFTNKMDDIRISPTRWDSLNSQLVNSSGGATSFVGKLSDDGTTLALVGIHYDRKFEAVLTKEGVSTPSATAEIVLTPDERKAYLDEAFYVLSAVDADLSEAPEVIVENSPPNLGGWHGDTVVTFHFDVEAAGEYKVALNYSKPGYGDPADLKVTVGEESFIAPLPATGSEWSNYVEHEFCTATLLAGKTTLIIESTEPRSGNYVMNLRSVTLSFLDVKK
jgi:hypothetical protein